MNSMLSIPKSRKDFESNMNLLNESFYQNTIQISSTMARTFRGIKRTRRLPNERANLLSVDESARLQANTVAHFSMTKNENNELPRDE